MDVSRTARVASFTSKAAEASPRRVVAPSSVVPHVAGPVRVRYLEAYVVVVGLAPTTSTSTADVVGVGQARTRVSTAAIEVVGLALVRTACLLSLPGTEGALEKPDGRPSLLRLVA